MSSFRFGASVVGVLELSKYWLVDPSACRCLMAIHWACFWTDVDQENPASSSCSCSRTTKRRRSPGRTAVAAATRRSRLKRRSPSALFFENSVTGKSAPGRVRRSFLVEHRSIVGDEKPVR